MNVERVR